MSDLTYEGYQAVRDAMTVAEWERVRDKCRWEHMTAWQVLNEWPSLRGAGARVSEARRGNPECLCHCGADAIGTDDEGRWACGSHVEAEAE